MARPGKHNNDGNGRNFWWLVIPGATLAFWLPVMWWLGFFDAMQQFFAAAGEWMKQPIQETDLIIAILVGLLVLSFRRKEPRTISMSGILLFGDPRNDAGR